ncbi:nitroreductase family protein [Sporobolomyces salmoneus]|uniref:nitroreductase family protein n=1 Tax=Sporobolomyces salmoneus TaxID=183962 RepID=UPI00317C3BF4
MSSTPAIQKKSFQDAVKERRSIYPLGRELPQGVTDEKIIELINNAVKHSPTSFNSQSSRAVVLLHKHHEKFWDFVKEKIKSIVDEKTWNESSSGRLNGFQSAYGTVLLFEDQSVVQQYQKNIPLYAEHFPTWSEHAHGILAYVAWTSLEAEGFGANLQHYNPLVDDKVQQEWKIPESWKLRGQLVFGQALQPAGEKEFQPLEERVKVFQ